MSSDNESKLRKEAEGLLDEPSDEEPRSATKTIRLLHELRVHQVELELQNEELRLSRAAVEEGLARFTELYDFAPAGYFTFVRDGSIREVNLPGARLLGTERTHILSRPLTRFLAVERRGAFAAWLEGVFSSDATERHVTTLIGEDKAPRAIEIEAALAASGDEARAIVVDITARLELEEQLRQSQKLDTLGQLAGGVAHDFNNILAAMMLSMDSLERNPDMPAACPPALSDLQSLAKRASDLTRQLLQFSRRRALDRGEIDLSSTLRPLLAMLERLLGEQITYVWRETDQSLRVYGDLAQLEQAVVNLCLNARDAMVGHGTLTLETSLVEFDGARTRENPHGRTGQFACVAVNDTGCGMSAETARRVFEPFFTTKAVGKGTGLGLSSTLRVIEQHDGWITLESEVGRGTRFCLYLPLSATASTASPSTMPPPTQPRGKTILVVEDEKIVLGVCAGALEAFGYSVLSAQDGPTALALWSKHRSEIELLLTDMRMPGGMTGLELAQKIWATAPTLKVIIMSGYGDEILQESALPHTLLQKPFNSKALGKAVRRALAHLPRVAAT